MVTASWFSQATIVKQLLYLIFWFSPMNQLHNYACGTNGWPGPIRVRNYLTPLPAKPLPPPAAKALIWHACLIMPAVWEVRNYAAWPFRARPDAQSIGPASAQQKSFYKISGPLEPPVPTAGWILKAALATCLPTHHCAGSFKRNVLLLMAMWPASQKQHLIGHHICVPKEGKGPH